MANTTFANLKIGALNRAGNSYNSNDATLLSIAGGLINDICSQIAQAIKGHPYTLDLGNTVSTVASQAYVDLTDTDIIELIQFTQRSTNSKLKQLTYEEYVTLFPNTTLVGGVPELVWAPTQSVVIGVATWRVYLGWTPSSVITMYYDYVKNCRFSSDGTSANAEYCFLPSIYDRWIYAEFAPLLYGIIDPTNVSRIQKAELKAIEVRTACLNDLNNARTHTMQMGRFGDDMPVVFRPVAITTAP